MRNGRKISSRWTISRRGSVCADTVRRIRSASIRKSGYDMFMDMIRRIKEDSVEKPCLVQIRREEEVERIEEKQRQNYIMSRGRHPCDGDGQKGNGQGRSERPCPCGSGKKYKKCCGK